MSKNPELEVVVVPHPTNPYFDTLRIGPKLPHHRFMECVIDLRQARLIARNLLAGKPYYIASPMYSLTRVQMAAIHLNANKILKESDAD